MMKIEVLRLNDPEVKAIRSDVGPDQARENLRRAIEASRRLRDYIENRETRLFPEKRGGLQKDR